MQGCQPVWDWQEEHLQVFFVDLTMISLDLGLMPGFSSMILDFTPPNSKLFKRKKLVKV